jgi:hypothetical protein
MIPIPSRMKSSFDGGACFASSPNSAAPAPRSQSPRPIAASPDRSGLSIDGFPIEFDNGKATRPLDRVASRSFLMVRFDADHLSAA